MIAIAAFALVFWYIRRRRNNRHPVVELPDTTGVDPAFSPQMQTFQSRPKTPEAELATPVIEMEGSRVVGSDWRAAELAANEREKRGLVEDRVAAGYDGYRGN